MRCNPIKACGNTVKYAGKIARKRRICGSCWYAIMTIAVKLFDLNCLNNSIIMKNHAR